MYKLSKIAIEMLNNEKKEVVPKDYNEIKSLILDEGYPIYDKVIECQQRYGGISYRFNDSNEGFKLGVTCYDPYRKEHGVIAYDYEGEYYFSCADYHKAAPVAVVMNQDGKVFIEGSMYKPFMIADNIEKFIEKDAIRYYFCKKQDVWYEKAVDVNKLYSWIEQQKYCFERIEEASDSCTIWWKDNYERIFLELDRIGMEYPQGLVYADSKDVLDNLFNESVKSAITYPNFSIVEFDKKNNTENVQIPLTLKETFENILSKVFKFKKDK